MVLLSLAVVPLVLLVIPYGGVSLAMLVVAAASLAGGIAVFLTHGGRRITAAGLYCLTAGVMVGSGGWYWSTEALLSTTRGSILLAALLIYGSTALTYAVFWRRSIPAIPMSTEHRPPIRPAQAWTLQLLGVLFFAIGTGLQFTVGTLSLAIAEVGVILVAASLVLSGGVRVLRSPARTFAVGAAVLVFYIVVFAGYGRLRLAALVLIIVIIAQYRLITRIKLLTVAALLPTLFLFAAIGQERVAEETGNPSIQTQAEGLGSLVNPLAVYGQLLEGRVTGGQGSTLLAEAVTLVPRGLWPDKPVQFGATLVPELRPDLADTNLSIACMSQCEWYYNFSFPGIVLSIPVLGFGIRWLDDRFARRIGKPLSHTQAIYVLLLLSILVGSMSDLAWGGTATWVARNMQRGLVLVPALAWTYVTSRERPAHAKKS